MLVDNGFTVDMAASSMEARLRRLCSLGPRSTTKQLWNALTYLKGEFEMLEAVPHLQLVPTHEFGTQLARYNMIYRYGPKSARNVIVLGAHYDTVPGTVGADDNASGVTSVLELLGLFRFHQPVLKPGFAVEFVLFTNEEPPHFSSKEMGSYHYFHKSLPRRGKVEWFVNLDCLGFVADEDRRAWFIVDDKDLKSRRIFSQWDAGVQAVPHDHSISGLGMMSDLKWVVEKSPCVHLCDMAISGNPNMHRPSDTPDTLNYRWMAQVVQGLYDVLVKEYQIE